MTAAGLENAGWPDILVVTVAVGLMLLVGHWRPANALGDYLLAARRVSAPGFVMSLVTAWYGGILGISEYSYTYGLSNWFVFGVPYYLYALIFAFVLAKRVRRSELMSLPDRFQQAYGTRAAQLCGGIIFLTAMPAAYLLMLGKLIQWMTGLPYGISLICGTAITTLYLFRGGLRSVIRTDTLQFVFMYAGFAIMVVLLYAKFGGLEFIRAHVPPESLTATGGQAIGAVLVWYFIASTTLVEPLFYERASAARSDKVVVPGFLAAILFWVVFDFMTTASGLYARAILGTIESPVFAFPELAAKVLPAGLFGLFLAALIATVASTVDSYMFIAGAALGRDVLSRGKQLDEGRSLRYVRWGALWAVLTALGLAWLSDSVISLWHAIGSIAAPALLLPALFAWFSKKPPPSSLVVPAMLLAGGAALVWRLSSLLTADGRYWLDVEPIFVGLAISAVLLLPPRLAKR